LAIVLILSNNSYSQKFLAIDSPNGAKRYRFYKGDYIRFQTKDKLKIKGHIGSIDTNYVMVSKVKYPLNTIRKFKIDKKKYGYRLAANLFTIAGTGSLGLGLLNGAINNDSPILNQNQLITSFSLLGLGITASLLNQKGLKIKEDWQLKVIDLDISENQP
jgi:hypothetical protein